MACRILEVVCDPAPADVLEKLHNIVGLRMTAEQTRDRIVADELPVANVTIYEHTVPSTVGTTLKSEWRTERVMSDVWDDYEYITFWDAEAGVRRTIRPCGMDGSQYDITRKVNVYTYLPGFAPTTDTYYNSTYVYNGQTACHFVSHHWTIDATDEAKAAAEAWEVEQHRLAAVRGRARHFAKNLSEIKQDLGMVKRDRDAVVVKGRKVAKGTQVRVTFVGEGQYGQYAKVILPDGKTTFIDYANLKAVRPDDTRHEAGIVARNYGLSERTAAVIREWFAGRNGLTWSMVCDALAEESNDSGYGGDEFADFCRKEVHTLDLQEQVAS